MRKRREGNSNIFKKINQQKKFQKEENFRNKNSLERLYLTKERSRVLIKLICFDIDPPAREETNLQFREGE